MAEGNKNQWVAWTIAIGAIVITLVAFNYQGDKTEVVPLSEIFPDEEMQEVEYEFVMEEKSPAPAAATQQVAVVPEVVSAPASAPQKATTVAQAVMPGPYYTIQVLASKNKNGTEKALTGMKEDFPTAFMVTKDLGDKGTWYRIYVGKFEQKNQADSYLSSVKKNYMDSFIRLIKK